MVGIITEKHREMVGLITEKHREMVGMITSYENGRNNNRKTWMLKSGKY